MVMYMVLGSEREKKKRKGKLIYFLVGEEEGPSVIVLHGNATKSGG